MRKAVVILPTYNEAKNISKLVDEILLVSNSIKNWEIHILVVDSNSPDDTGKILDKLYNSDRQKYANLHILHTQKEGLGKAYLEGFQKAISDLKPYVLFEMDADFSHDPKTIPMFLEEIEKGADFVIGSRYRKNGSIPKDWAWTRKLYSVLGNWIIRIGFMRLNITEWTNGFRAIKSWIVVKALDHVKNYNGYVFQVAMLDFAVNNKAIIKEIPIHFKDREQGYSKINSFQYIVQTLFYVLGHSSFIKFCVVGALGFIVDFGLASLFILFFQFPKVSANIYSAELAIISNFFLNNFWSFGSKKIIGITKTIGNLIYFNFISLGSLIIQGTGLWLALKFIGDYTIELGKIELHSWVLYKIILIILIIIPYSYILYNKFVWKN